LSIDSFCSALAERLLAHEDLDLLRGLAAGLGCRRAADDDVSLLVVDEVLVESSSTSWSTWSSAGWSTWRCSSCVELDVLELVDEEVLELVDDEVEVDDVVLAVVCDVDRRRDGRPSGSATSEEVVVEVVVVVMWARDAAAGEVQVEDQRGQGDNGGP